MAETHVHPQIVVVEFWLPFLAAFSGLAITLEYLGQTER